MSAAECARQGPHGNQYHDSHELHQNTQSHQLIGTRRLALGFREHVEQSQCQGNENASKREDEQDAQRRREEIVHTPLFRSVKQVWRAKFLRNPKLSMFTKLTKPCWLHAGSEGGTIGNRGRF